MIAKGGYRGLPLALAAAVGLWTAASAQQATQPAATETPARQAKPKSTKSAAPKSEQKSESEQKAAPAGKKNTAQAAPAPAA